MFIIPRVFANGEGDLAATILPNGLPFARHEVTAFVKDVISGQQHLALLEDYLPAGKHLRGIRQLLAGRADVRGYRTDDNG